MNQLKCTTANCQHNLKCHCMASIVGIDEKGVCDTKIKRLGGALEQTFAELEASTELLADAPNVVQCDAECVYNKDMRCTSNAILVSDAMFRTRCETRTK